MHVRVCVTACPDITVEINDLWTKYRFIQFDRIQVKFEDQGHSSEFAVAIGNRSSLTVGMADRGVVKGKNKWYREAELNVKYNK